VFSASSPENTKSGQRDLMKILISVVLSGPIIQWTYFAELTLRVEPLSSSADIFNRAGDFDHRCIVGGPDMAKFIRISTPVTASDASSRKSDSSPLVSIALFSGVGLLVSLLAVLLGVPGVWQ
jgi:hypothetical protein